VSAELSELDRDCRKLKNDRDLLDKAQGEDTDKLKAVKERFLQQKQQNEKDTVEKGTVLMVIE
jgi:hypothetical protein